MKRRDFFKAISVAAAATVLTPTQFFFDGEKEFEFDNKKFIFKEHEWGSPVNQDAFVKHFTTQREDGQRIYATVAISHADIFDYEHLDHTVSPIRTMEQFMKYPHVRQIVNERKKDALTMLWDLYREAA